MIIAQVLSQTGSDPWSQTGVMIRNHSTAAAPEASVLSTPGNGVPFRYRPTAGGTTAQTFTTGITPPVWLRLARATNTFTAACSPDGVNWTTLGSPQTIPMGNPVANVTQAFAGPGTIGTDTYASAARAFNGLMDEVAVFNQALTTSQLQQLFASGHQLPSVRVSLQPVGGNFNVLWPQGTLLQAPALTGPWKEATAGTPSPLTIQPTNPAMFYRVLLQ